jgi:hypothetical protein
VVSRVEHSVQPGQSPGFERRTARNDRTQPEPLRGDGKSFDGNWRDLYLFRTFHDRSQGPVEVAEEGELIRSLQDLAGQFLEPSVCRILGHVL